MAFLPRKTLPIVKLSADFYYLPAGGTRPFRGQMPWQIEPLCGGQGLYYNTSHHFYGMTSTNSGELIFINENRIAKWITNNYSLTPQILGESIG